MYRVKEGWIAMERTFNNRIFRLILFTFLALVCIFVVYLVYRFTGIGFKCLFFEISGFKCAGCGNTHALQSLLQLDFLTSFSYNYIYPVEMLYILWVYLNSAKSYIKNGKFNYKSPCQVFDIIVLVIVVLWIPLRNILGV